MEHAGIDTHEKVCVGDHAHGEIQRWSEIGNDAVAFAPEVEFLVSHPDDPSNILGMTRQELVQRINESRYGPTVVVPIGVGVGDEYLASGWHAARINRPLRIGVSTWRAGHGPGY